LNFIGMVFGFFIFWGPFRLYAVVKGIAAGAGWGLRGLPVVAYAALPALPLPCPCLPLQSGGRATQAGWPQCSAFRMFNLLPPNPTQIERRLFFVRQHNPKFGYL